MNKIYIGNTEVANVGSGGGGGQEFNPSDYVDASTWNEHEKVIASALVNLKGLENKIEAFDESIQAQETALLAEVHVVEQTKADVSVVYLKLDIDKSDKVVAAALASLNERVTTLETSSGGSGDSGDSFGPEYLEVELADVSNRLDFLGDLTLDISSRVNALEQVDYVVTNDISAFVKENDISTFITDNDISTFVTQTALDASFIELDASIIALDASVKELASSGGGGGSGTDPVFIKVTNSGDSNKTGFVNQYAQYDLSKIGNYSIVLTGDNPYNKPEASGLSSVASGRHSIASGLYSAAFCEGTSQGNYSFSSNLGKSIGQCSFSANKGCANGLYSAAFGEATTANNVYAFVAGYNSSVGGEDGAVAIGSGLIVQSYTESAFGYLNKEYNAHNYPFDGSTDVLVHSIGNGSSKQGQKHRHNAFEVRQSGDIYVADVSAAGEYYEKPMINLQQKLYALDASIQSLSAGGGGSSTDLTNYVFLHHDSQNDTFKLKSTEPGGHSAPVTELYIETLKTSSIMSTDPLTDNFILIESGEMYIKRNETLYQIDLDAFVTSFGTDVTQ